MKKGLLLFYTLVFFAGLANAAPVLEKRNGALWVKSTTTRELEKLFEQYNFYDYSDINMKFPRIYVKKLPTDWQKIPQTDNKHRMFVRMLLPLVLKLNEDILKERAQIEKINEKFRNDGKLSAEEIKFVEEKAKKYDVFTPFDGRERTSVQLNRLLLKVDEVPPSIMISTAAIYTDWGMSRLAVEANSLYQEEVWYENQGLRPNDDKNAEYRYKIFSDLEECMISRALKLNSHINYEYFREARMQSRKHNHPPMGQQLVAEMMQDNNLKNIAGMIDYTFTYYDLFKTDYFPKLEDVK